MNRFALQVDVANGETWHWFASDPGSYDFAVTLRDTWRQQDPDTRHVFGMPDGSKRQVFVRDIRDVRVVGGGR